MLPTIKFAILLPTLNLLLSASIFVFPAMRGYRMLQRAPRSGSMIVLRGNGNEIRFSQDHAIYIACYETALSVQEPVVALNIPAQFVHALLGWMQGKNAHWFPQALGPALWRVVSFPFFALPAWWFTGRGIDRLMGGTRSTKWDLWFGALLASSFGFLAVGLRFGLTSAERQGQQGLDWSDAGLLLWCMLFTIPVVAWIRIRIATKKMASTIAE